MLAEGILVEPAIPEGRDESGYRTFELERGAHG
jgi:hypothetical protein